MDNPSLPLPLGVTRLFFILILRMIGFFIRLARRATTASAIRYGRVKMRLPLHIPNASSLVDFTFHKVNHYYPSISKVSLLRFSFLSLIRGFFLFRFPSVGDLYYLHYRGWFSTSFFFWKRKEKQEKKKTATSTLYF